MVAEFAMQGISALSNALSIINTIKDVSDRSQLNAALGAVNEQLIKAQAAAIESQRQESSLVDSVRELRDRISKLEDWNAEKQRYQLEEIPPGFFVYGVKPDARGAEPDHKLCATCYQNGEKSFLHRGSPHTGLVDWHCNKCGFTATSGTFSAPHINRGPGGHGGKDGWMAR